MSPSVDTASKNTSANWQGRPQKSLRPWHEAGSVYAPVFPRTEMDSSCVSLR